MDVELPDRSIKKLRVDTKVLSDVVAIMSRGGRRAVVKINDHKIDDLSGVSASDLTDASEVDVSSFWVNPERPHFGRRHFVYFLAGPADAKYFGDSVSPEVTRVCEELDVYFNQQAATADGAPLQAGVAGLPAWWPRGWLFETPERVVSALALAGLLIALLAFMVGRWSAADNEAAVLDRPIPTGLDTTVPPPTTMPLEGRDQQ